MRWPRYPTLPYALEKTPHVWGIGPEGECSLVFVGESPGEQEVSLRDSQGNRILEPFIGEAGRILMHAFSLAHIYRGGVWITNLISVRPPRNDIHSAEAQEAWEAEKEEFWKEIEFVIKQKGAKVIVALGAEVAKVFGLPDSISTIRGSVYEWNLNWRGIRTDPTAEALDAVLIPTYHPSYIAHKGRWYSRGKGKSDLFLTFVEDIRKAKKIAEEGYTPPKRSILTSPTVRDVEQFVQRILQSPSTPVALDTETVGSERTLVMVGMADSPTSALVVPFLKKGGLEYWNPFEKPLVISHLQRLFTTHKTFVFQNASFDVGVLLRNGFPFPFEHIAHDIMLLHHVMHAELPHDLAFICSVYGTHYTYWKSTLKSPKRTEHILDIDDEELRMYNALDAMHTLDALGGLLKELEEFGERVKHVYYGEELKLVGPVVSMLLRGVGYDRKAHREWAEKRLAELEELERKLREEWNLPPPFDLSSDLDMGYLLFGIVPKTYLKHEELEKKREGTKVYRTLLGYREILQKTKPFRLPPQFTPRRTEKTQSIQLNRKNRVSYIYAMVKRIQYLQSLKRPTPEHEEEIRTYEAQIRWLQLYEEYTSKQTLLNTFSHFPNVINGRIYPDCLIHGTVTGRLSFRNPNMQNMPKKDKEFRKVFVAPPGYVLLSADYVNLEVGTLAYESQDPTLIEIFEKGMNLHDINTQILFGITKEDPNWEVCRRAAKIDQFGTQYGGSDREVYTNIITEIPSLHLSFEKYLELRKRKFEAFPVFARWYTQTIERAKRERKTETFLGRVRYLYGNESDIGKEGLNTPCQGAAAHIINRATIRIFHRLRQRKLDAHLIIQIHDQLVFEVNEGCLRETARIVKEEMEWPVMFHNRKAVFPVELEVGKNLSQLSPLDL